MTGQKLCYILGGIALVYGVGILALLGPGAVFHWFFVCLGAVLVLAGICLPKIMAWNPWVRRGICVCLALILLDFIWFEVRAVRASVKGTNLQECSCDWIIVLGAGLRDDGTPKQEYEVRLERAEQLSSGDSSLILTGGQGRDEIISEAESGEAYLRSRGKLAAEKVFLETESTDTVENLRNALMIIRKNGGSEKDRVLIVSSGFHLYRASLLAAKAGYENVECAGTTGPKFLLPSSFVQEYVSYMWARIRRIL